METDSKSITIRRTLNSANNSSKWMLNGQTVTMQAVKNIVNSMGIDVDNLCSFMPQDKVGNFSHFSPKEVLQNTLKSIQNPNDSKNLYDEQRELSSIESSKENQRRERDSIQKLCNDLTRQLEALGVEKERYERRNKAISLKKFCQMQLLVVEATELEQRKSDLEQVLNQSRSKLIALKEAQAPKENDLRHHKRVLASIDKDFDRLSSTIKSFENKAAVIRGSIEDLEIKVEDTKNELDSMENRRMESEQKLVKLNKDLAIAVSKLEAANQTIPAIRSDISELEKTIHEKENSVSKSYENNERQEAILHEKRSQQEDLRKQIDGLQDFKEIYRGKLRESNDRSSRDTLKAMEIIDKLTLENKFSEDVFGPIGMYCSSKDPACAIMIEKAIPINRLMGFVAQSDKDANLLKAELRDRNNLQVDVLTVKNCEVVLQAKRPYSREAMSQLSGHGIAGYLADQLDCPDIIRAYLYSFHQLNTILWGRTSNGFRGDQFKALCPDGVNGFRLFVHDPKATDGSSRYSFAGSIMEYTGRRSRYAPPSAAPSIASSPVYARGNLLGGKIEDTDGKKQQLVEQMKAVKAELGHIEEKIKANIAQIDNQKTELLALRGEKMRFQKLLQEPSKWNNVKNQLEKQITGLTKSVSSDVLQEKLKHKANYQKAISDLIQTVSEGVSLAQKSVETRSWKGTTGIRKELVTSKIIELEASIQEDSCKLKEIEDAIKGTESEISNIDVLLDSKKQVFSNFEAEFADVEDLGDKIKEACPFDKISDIEERIFELGVDIENTKENAQVVSRYHDTETTLQTQLTRLAELSTEYNNTELTLNSRKEKWENDVMALTTKLSNAFKEYMHELGFGGEVDLRRKGTFLDYEMILQVSFRAHGVLSELDGNRHSGGERAVSTIMFLMALQDLTQSPFRVVDEINQGMDERNERLVVDRIVKNCCGDHKPQYFLITPKLLPALLSLRNPNVTVLCVRNGPGR